MSFGSLLAAIYVHLCEGRDEDQQRELDDALGLIEEEGEPIPIHGSSPVGAWSELAELGDVVKVA